MERSKTRSVSRVSPSRERSLTRSVSPEYRAQTSDEQSWMDQIEYAKEHGNKRDYFNLTEEFIKHLNNSMHAQPMHHTGDDEKMEEQDRALAHLRNNLIREMAQHSYSERWQHIYEMVETQGFQYFHIAELEDSRRSRSRSSMATDDSSSVPSSRSISLGEFGSRSVTPVSRRSLSIHDAAVLNLPAVPAMPRRRAPRVPRVQVPHHVRMANRNVVRAQAAGVAFQGGVQGQFRGYVGADRGAQNVPYGRVHLVQMANIAGRTHFMNELVQDANMGRIRVETSRKGPFRGTSGHIKTMARSTHVVYRVRGGVIQITVYRGVIKTELDVLVGKLGAHRISTPKTICTLVVRGKKRKLGDLQTLDLSALRGVILESLSKAKSVGISLHDMKNNGSLHRLHRPEREYK